MYRVRFVPERAQMENGLIDIDECVETMERMFCVMAQGDYLMSGKSGNSHGERLVLDRKGDDKNKNIYIAMPAYLGGEYQCAGVKWHGPNVAGSSDTETKHTLIINDLQTGIPLGILPANMLTTYRTAAVSVYAAKLCAVRESKTVGIIGPGRINTVFLDGLLHIFRDVTTVKIKGRGKSSIERLAARIRAEHKNIVDIQIADTFEEAVRDADIVSINTGFDFENIRDMPIIRTDWVKPGATLLCSAFIKFSDDFIVHRAKKVADNFKMYESYAEELGYPAYRGLSNLGNRYVDLIKEGKITKDDIIDLPDIAAGRKEARKNAEDIVIFSSGGMGIEDLAVGYHILKKAEEQNVGTLLEW